MSKSKPSKNTPKDLPKNQIHGEVEKFVPTTLDQIWGDTGENKYKTHSEEEYAHELKTMNKSDLQRHCTKYGLLPTDNREIMEKRLLKEFRNHVAAYRKPFIQTSAKPISKRASDILSEGR